MPDAENSMRREFTYGGRNLWTTVQWTEEGPNFNVFAFINLYPLNDLDKVERWTGHAIISDPAMINNSVLRVPLLAAYAYIDSLEPSAMMRQLKNEAYTDGTTAQDLDDFWYFTEFDYVTGGNPRP